jgi:hypothetical protein
MSTSTRRTSPDAAGPHTFFLDGIPPVLRPRLVVQSPFTLNLHHASVPLNRLCGCGPAPFGNPGLVGFESVVFRPRRLKVAAWVGRLGSAGFVVMVIMML